MKDNSRQNEVNRPEDSPGWPQLPCSPEVLRTYREGIRLIAKIAVRSHMRKHVSRTPKPEAVEDAGSKEDDSGISTYHIAAKC